MVKVLLIEETVESSEGKTEDDEFLKHFGYKHTSL